LIIHSSNMYLLSNVAGTRVSVIVLQHVKY